MSREKALEALEAQGFSDRAMFFEDSCATVALAARAVGVEEARICKTLSFYNRDMTGCIIIQTAGDSRVNNGMFKRTFGFKPRMLSAEDVLRFTGHEPGGVCAFGTDPKFAEVYSDESLKRFDLVYPACGTLNSAVRLTPEELFIASNSIDWVSVSKY